MSARRIAIVPVGATAVFAPFASESPPANQPGLGRLVFFGTKRVAIAPCLGHRRQGLFVWGFWGFTFGKSSRSLELSISHFFGGS